MHRIALALVTSLALTACTATPPERAVAPQYDLVLRGGTIYDGSGGAPFVGDVAVRGDRLAVVGTLPPGYRTARVVDVSGMAVCPGFINMLSWANLSLLHDGRSLSDLRQGVTLEIMGEGVSMGPLNDEMRAQLERERGELKYEVEWASLGEYLAHLEARGVSTNVASFVGATTVRIHVIGYEDRRATAEELERMRGLVETAMREGAMGVGSSLIYTPAFFADTDELVALSEVAARHGGMYISHVRNESQLLLEAVDEFLEIVRRSGVRGEIYHLKAAGAENWGKLDAVLAKLEAARAEGLAVGADMYTYTAGATGLNAAMPPWVQEGGEAAWRERLADPQVRARLREEMRRASDEWENLYHAAGGPENVILVEFRNPALRPLTGKTLAEVAEQRGTNPEDTIMDLIVEDASRVGAVYFLMSEENVARKLATPWITFGSDEASLAPEGAFLESNPHPRAYGNFARLLGRYVREQGALSLAEAIHRLTALPAANLGLAERGRLAPGLCADVVVFDPDTIRDHATYEAPHELSTGVSHVFVNGVQVLHHGEHTGASPGRFVHGPGYRGD